MESWRNCCYCHLAFLFLLLLSFSNSRVQADEAAGMHMVTDAGLEWPMPMSSSLYGGDLGDNDGEISSGGRRRSLFWHRVKYYISYGALSADRIPCPPRSGRSYYTHNCYFATGPVHPYTRGCSAITRCRR